MIEKILREDGIRCIFCGKFYSWRQIRRYNRMHGYVLDYLPPCSHCGCTQYIQAKNIKERR
jgi:hypothetical protein